MRVLIGKILIAAGGLAMIFCLSVTFTRQFPLLLAFPLCALFGSFTGYLYGNFVLSRKR